MKDKVYLVCCLAKKITVVFSMFSMAFFFQNCSPSSSLKSKQSSRHANYEGIVNTVEFSARNTN